MTQHICLIFCKIDSFTLDDAQTALDKTCLTVERDRDRLICFGNNSPRFTISLNQGEEVRAKVKTISEEYPNYRSRLKNCNICFEVSFANLSEVLDEINTLIEIQLTLQDATEGIVFTSWNGIIEI